MRSFPILVLVVLLSAGALGDDKPKLALDEILHGKVLSLKKGVIEIAYDFEDEAQLEDWVKSKPFKVGGELAVEYEGEQVRLNGTGSLRHTATFLEEVSIELQTSPLRDRDLGAVVSEDADSEQYVLFCINDFNFQRWDGAKKPQHMICRFGVIDPSEPEGSKVFRYIARAPKPEIKPYQRLRLFAERKGRKHLMEIGEESLKGTEGHGREINQLHVGAYVVKSSMMLHEAKVRGRLSARWLERVNAKLELKEPPPEDAGPTPEDLAAEAKIRLFRAGAATAEEVVLILDDRKVAEEVREKASEVIAASGDKKLVPRLVNYLYSEDVVTRRLSNDAVKVLTGRSFGYDAKDPADKRSKAIQKLVKFIQQKPREFGR